MKKPFQPKAMLVTGGAGFIGCNFIRHVLSVEPNILIVNIDKLTYAGTLDNLKQLPNEERHHFIKGDINDRKLIEHVLHHYHIDTIVHFAAESHVDRSIHAPSPFVETNVVGTYTLLEAARHHWFDVDEFNKTHCRFHHVSTDEVYGALGLHDSPFNEKTAYQPRSPYSATKAGSDHLVNAYYHTYGLPITISHSSNNYGPYQNNEKFIPTVINACLTGKKIPIYGQGKQIRDWLYVDDHCRALMKIITEGNCGETYDIGANNEWENVELAKYICRELDVMLREISEMVSDVMTDAMTDVMSNVLEFVKDRPGHDFRYAIDSTKMKTELGWVPKEAMESGIRKTLRFYLERHSAKKSTQQAIHSF